MVSKGCAQVKMSLLTNQILSILGISTEAIELKVPCTEIILGNKNRETRFLFNVVINFVFEVRADFDIIK